MSKQASGFAMLIDVEKETSSDRRRDMLRQITDKFLAEGRGHAPSDAAMLDELVSAVSDDLSHQVRVELAANIARSAIPLKQTTRKLATSHIDVAHPVLIHSKALSEADMLHVIGNTSQDHMLALTARPDIGEKVARALVHKGEDHVVVSLLQNKQARIDSETYEAVAERAQKSEVLHAPFVRRQGVPLHLLNDLYLKVELKLRREILHTYGQVPKAELDSAFEKSRARLSTAYTGLPSDYDAAVKRIGEMEKKNALKPPTLVTLLRERDKSHTAFYVAFARLAGVEYSLVQHFVEAPDLDAIALLCRAANFDKALFVTLAMMIVGSDRRMGNVEEYGKLYEEVPLVAAQRALRFWKVRSQADAA
jgi:uncharacterized protein (DUF2336 family)